MSARAILLRNAVADKINTDKSGYVITDLEISTTYYPQTRLEAAAIKPQISIIALTFDLQRVTRGITSTELQIPIQVGITRKVNPTDTSLCDILAELLEQIQTSAAQAVTDTLISGNRYSWLGNEALRDARGSVVDYQRLQVENCWQSIFTANYQHYT